MSEPIGCSAEEIETTLAPPAAPGAQAGTTLAEHTTLRVGGPARRFEVATTEADLVRLVSEADAAGEPVLVLGGGSNLVVGDAGFDGLVVQVATRGLRSDTSDCAGASVDVAAGEPWDALVAHAVENQWVGLECLSGIPGSVGASPIQNIGAYGSEVAQTCAKVRTWDRRERAQKTFAAADCGFAYRTSRFKEERYDDFGSRYVVLEVSFQLELGALSVPIAYAELARQLGVEVGERAPLAQVRDTVRRIRAGKGMVLDPADHDTWSAGSFFTNPIVDAAVAEKLPADAPRYPTPDGRVKSSAAWLIDHAGFAKGYGLAGDGSDRATLSTKHTLALTNRGDARAADVLALAGRIADGVEAAYGIRLVPEPVFVNATLPAATARPAAGE